MRIGWSRLLLLGMIAAAMMLAADRAHGSVVFSDRDFSASGGLVVDLSPWSATGLPGSDRVSSPSGYCTALAIEVPSGGAADEDQVQPPNRPSFTKSPAGMLPSSSSLSQVAGSGIGGAAVENQLEATPQDSLQATLSPESRTVLPSGPVFRWFRPPRV